MLLETSLGMALGALLHRSRLSCHPTAPRHHQPQKNLIGRHLPPLQITPDHKLSLKRPPAAQGASSCVSWTLFFWGASEQGQLCSSLVGGLCLLNKGELFHFSLSTLAAPFHLGAEAEAGVQPCTGRVYMSSPHRCDYRLYLFLTAFLWKTTW